MICWTLSGVLITVSLWCRWIHRVRPVATGAQEDSAPLHLCAPPNFAVPKKICFKNTIKTKFFPHEKVNFFVQFSLFTTLTVWRTCGQECRLVESRYLLRLQNGSFYSLYFTQFTFYSPSAWQAKSLSLLPPWLCWEELLTKILTFFMLTSLDLLLFW